MTKKKTLNNKREKQNKYYAIKEGKGVENIIVRTWTECKELVHGYNAVYKSFNNLEDAKKYLKEVNVTKVKQQTKYQRIKKNEIKKTTKYINGFRISNEIYEDLQSICKGKGISIETVIKFAISKYLY